MTRNPFTTATKADRQAALIEHDRKVIEFNDQVKQKAGGQRDLAARSRTTLFANKAKATSETMPAPQTKAASYISRGLRTYGEPKKYGRR